MVIFVTVKKKTPLPLVVFSIIISLIIFFAIILPLLSTAKIPLTILSFIVLFMFLPLILSIYIARKYGKISRRIDKLKSMTVLGDNELKLPYSIRVEKGEAEIGGYWTSSGRSRSYRHYCIFIPKSPPEYVESIGISNFKSKQTILIDIDGSGVIKAPAIRVLEPEFQDLLLIVINPKLNLKRQHLSIRVASEGDIAEASIEVEDNILSGVIYRPIIGKARKARLELRSKIKPSKGSEQQIVKVIARAKTSSTNFKLNLSLKEPIIILSHKDAISPNGIARTLKWSTPVIMGFGHGEYKLRLVLNLPFRRDVFREVPFQLSE